MTSQSFMKAFLAFFLLGYAITTHAIDITKEISGSWFNSQQDGHGFILEVIPGNKLVAYWFAYDPNGRQAWMVGVGDISGDTATVPVIITEGGIFGDNFDPNAIIRNNWGSLIFTFDSCNTGNVIYNVGFGSGSLPIQRLTSLDGLECQDPPPSTPACANVAGSWSGTWSEIYCDGEPDFGTWSGIFKEDCSFVAGSPWVTVFGTVSGNTLTATGDDPFCGVVNVTGTISGNRISGTYTYSRGGGGDFSGSKQ